MAGFYSGSFSGFRGFVYVGLTWTTLIAPAGVNGTFAQGISGNNVVGFYVDGLFKNHGFLYDGTTWTTLNDPAAGSNGTVPLGISGNRIVGAFSDSSSHQHGFLLTIPEPATLILFGIAALTISRRPSSRTII